MMRQRLYFVQMYSQKSYKGHLYMYIKWKKACPSYKKEDMVWLSMRQLFTRDQMTQTFTAIGHCTAFNNEQCMLLVINICNLKVNSLEKSVFSVLMDDHYIQVDCTIVLFSAASDG